MALYQNRFMGRCASGDQFTFSWWCTSSATTASVNAAAVTWIDNLWSGETAGTGYGSMITADVVVSQVNTGLITTETGQQQELIETAHSIAGSAADPAMPADVALVVSLRTDVANRSGRGRFYLPQPASAELTADGRFNQTSQGNLIAALAYAWTGFTGSGIPVLYSRLNRVTTTLTKFDVGDLFDTQRRRENKVLENRMSEPMP